MVPARSLAAVCRNNVVDSGRQKASANRLLGALMGSVKHGGKKQEQNQSLIELPPSGVSHYPFSLVLKMGIHLI
jgi:hypothetical protein